MRTGTRCTGDGPRLPVTQLRAGTAHVAQNLRRSLACFWKFGRLAPWIDDFNIEYVPLSSQSWCILLGVQDWARVQFSSILTKPGTMEPFCRVPSV